MDQLDRQYERKLRRIVEHQDFKSQCSVLFKQFPRFKDVLQAIRLDLQECAHLDSVEVHAGYFYKTTQTVFETPAFTFYFKYDDNKVEVLAIEVDPDESTT